MVALIFGGIIAFFFLILFFIVVGSMFKGKADQNKAGEWAAMASRLRLQVRHDPGYLASIGGAWRGHQAKACVWRAHETQDATVEFVWTQIEVYWPRNPALGLSVNKLGAVTGKFGHAAGRSPRIAIGDPHFDRALVLKGHNPAAVGAFLQPALRAAMLRLVEMNDFVEFTDQSAGVQLRGWASQQEMVFWLDELARVVDVAVAIHGR